MGMRTLVIGANGKVGRILTPLLAEAGMEPLAMIRDPAQQATFSDRGIEVVVADLEEDFSSVFVGCDTVIFTAGSGGKTGADKTMVIDLYAALRSIDFAKAAGVQRFSMVSALKAHEPLAGPARIHHYLIAKHLADEHLKKSGLPYFILRPGGLKDEPGTGRVTLVEACPNRTGDVPRADVAAVLVEALRQELLGVTLELVGGATPIVDAVARVAREASGAA